MHTLSFSFLYNVSEYVFNLCGYDWINMGEKERQDKTSETSQGDFFYPHYGIYKASNRLAWMIIISHDYKMLDLLFLILSNASQRNTDNKEPHFFINCYWHQS